MVLSFSKELLAKTLPTKSFHSALNPIFTRLIFVPLPLILLIATGCASMFSGSKQSIDIASHPPGARIFINGNPSGVTPMQWDAPRNRNANVRMEMIGYDSYEVTLEKSFNSMSLFNFVFGAFGIIGVGIDAMNGSIYKLTPEEVNVFFAFDDAPTAATSSVTEASSPPHRGARRFKIDSQRLAAHKDATIAVLKLDPGAGITLDEAGMLSDRFSVELDRSGVYRIVSQSKMGEILEFQKFSADCKTVSCAIEAGQLLGVQYMVYGSIGKLGSMYSVNVNVVDVELGTVIAGASVDHDGRIEDLLSVGMGQAVDELLLAVSDKIKEP